ncbi:phage terminase large subunit [Methylophilus sp. DW102]|uniref:phage terminase large subunit n=1 Tax=Methylophilus sp. DW102 TaxID=3095607 RepID=UPI003090812F|nr:phage terminase large subunit [Methylophilus sp. DW102]BEV09350.1 phage terminase large subunit [Methylophilus sp. DW102]
MSDIDDLNIKTIKSWKEFEAELAQLGEDLREQIELECEAFDVDPAASLERRERALFDYEFFCRTYFPHYVPTEHFSLFQKFIFKHLPACIDSPRDARDVEKAPRGEAKSTYETQLGSLWSVCRATYIERFIKSGKLPKKARKHMIVIIMNTEEQAAEMLASVKAELDTNPRLAMDFPDAFGQGRVWQATTAITANNIKIRIGGTGKKLRGMKHGPHRPDQVHIDDAENDDNVKSPEQRKKTEDFILKAVLGLAGPAGGMDVFVVGTELHHDAAINRIGNAPGWKMRTFKSIVRWPDNMHLWDTWEAIYSRPGTADEKEEAETEALAFYEANKAEMEAGAIVSWPEVRPLYRLMCMRAIDHEAFNHEQQNEAGNDENAPFKTIQFWVNKLSNWLFFGSIDPSMGKKDKRRDPSAILVGGYNMQTMTLDVIEADIRRRVPDLIIEHAIDYQKQYNCLMWAVETVAFQEFLYTELLKRSIKEGVIFPTAPDGGVEKGRDKEMAILSLQPLINRGQIRLHHNQHTLNEQLKYYPEADHDDGPDALEMLWKVATAYSQAFEYVSAASDRRSRRNDDYQDD